MSNELSIATVTAALSQKLSDAFATDLGFAAKVTTVRPNAADTSLPTTGANIFLFLATPNAANRNNDLPRGPIDTPVRQPTVALDLHYLISFYGDEAQLEPQILLATTVLALHEEPKVDGDTIRAMQATNRFPALADSNLADAVDLVRFTPAALSLEELSKLWSVVFQTPYVLSSVYLAGAVFINHDKPVAASLPVRTFGLVAAPLQNPTITSIRVQTTVNGKVSFSAAAPIVAGSTLALTGTQLMVVPGRNSPVKPPPPLLQIDGADLPADPPITGTDKQLTLTLPPTLLAGAHGLQVVRSVDLQAPGLKPPAPELRTVTASNVATFVLRPQVANPTYAKSPQSITVDVTPSVGKEQRVRLLLNQTGAADGPSRSYAFNVPARSTAGDSDATLTVPVSNVVAGTYLVRIEVDNAQSVPTDAGVKYVTVS